MKPDTKILREKLSELLKTASKDKEAYSSLANILGQVGQTLAARAENGDAEAVIALGKIGFSFAGIFQRLSVFDDLHETAHTRPFYESAAFAPCLIGDEARNAEQLKVMVKLGKKWSPYPTWGRGRKRLNFTGGAQHMANRVAQNIYAQPPGKFKTPDEAFNFGFDQLVAEHGGKETFLRFEGPRAIAQSVKNAKGPGRKVAGKRFAPEDVPASIAQQMGEVKSKVKRRFKVIYIPRK